MKLDHNITEVIPVEKMLPAVGQGVICVQCLRKRVDICDMLRASDHSDTRVCVEAERAFLQEIEGDCHTPLAALAQIKNGMLYMRGLYGSDGEIYRAESYCQLHDAVEMGIDTAREVLHKANI